MRKKYVFTPKFLNCIPRAKKTGSETYLGNFVQKKLILHVNNTAAFQPLVTLKWCFTGTTKTISRHFFQLEAWRAAKTRAYLLRFSRRKNIHVDQSSSTENHIRIQKITLKVSYPMERHFCFLLFCSLFFSFISLSFFIIQFCFCFLSLSVYHSNRSKLAYPKYKSVRTIFPLPCILLNA